MTTDPPPTRIFRRALVATALAATAALTGAPPAAAEYKTTTAQALAAHAEWLPYAPPPPNGAAAVCLVDTGVDLNPDTASNVIARIALDGGDPSDLSDSKHGTQMAMVMGAPINDWGMVGAWPGVRIVSVRASHRNEPFTFDSYRNGIETCREFSSRIRIGVIELALGGAPPSEEQRGQLGEVLSETRREGINVVIAAGNAPGAVQEPALSEPAMAVASHRPSGGRCASSAYGSGVDLLAPGCDLDAADPRDGFPTVGAAGTSQASAFTAAVMAALRSARPDLSPDAAEQLLLRTADSSPDGPVLNARAAFAQARVLPAAAEGARSTGAVASKRPRAPWFEVLRWTRGQLRLRLLEPGNRLPVQLTAFRGRQRVLSRRFQAREIRLHRSVTRICITTLGAKHARSTPTCRSRSPRQPL